MIRKIVKLRVFFFYYFKQGPGLLIGENPRFKENILALAFVLKRFLNHSPSDL